MQVKRAKETSPFFLYRERKTFSKRQPNPLDITFEYYIFLLEFSLIKANQGKPWDAKPPVLKY